MTTTASHPMRELDLRCSDGIEVRLLWNPRDNQVLVAVADVKTGARFAVEVADHTRALHVFHHPYAYATDVHTHRVMTGHTGATEPAAS